MNQICTKCNKKYPMTTEYFSPRKRGKNGLRLQCRSCRMQASKKYQQTEKGKEHHRKDSALYCKRHPERVKETLKCWLNTINGHLRHTYSGMKTRCNNPDYLYYKNYGGRGIKCLFSLGEFLDYVIDVLKVDPRGLEIDRIDNNGHYEKGNIRFVTRTENRNNRRA